MIDLCRLVVRRSHEMLKSDVLLCARHEGQCTKSVSSDMGLFFEISYLFNIISAVFFLPTEAESTDVRRQLLSSKTS